MRLDPSSTHTHRPATFSPHPSQHLLLCQSPVQSSPLVSSGAVWSSPLPSRLVLSRQSGAVLSRQSRLRAELSHHTFCDHYLMTHFVTTCHLIMSFITQHSTISSHHTFCDHLSSSLIMSLSHNIPLSHLITHFVSTCHLI